MNIIKLNVGGHKYETTLSTIEKYPETMLARYFQSGLNLIKDELNYYFFDFDGKWFNNILTFYRTGMIHKPKDCDDLQWSQYPDYWGIDYDGAGPLISSKSCFNENEYQKLLRYISWWKNAVSDVKFSCTPIY